MPIELHRNQSTEKGEDVTVEMQFAKFVRKPFTVEAVEITSENLAEVAEMIGVLREKDNGTPYIAVDRRIIPNLYRVYAGFWMTRLGDNLRCYSKKVFREQFVENTPDIENWIKFLNEQNHPVYEEVG